MDRGSHAMGPSGHSGSLDEHGNAIRPSRTRSPARDARRSQRAGGSREPCVRSRQRADTHTRHRRAKAAHFPSSLSGRRSVGRKNPIDANRLGGAQGERKSVNADTIKYEGTVIDPTMFMVPWTLSLSLEREENYRLYEYACHEGNYSMNVRLSGARAEREAREAGKRTEKR